MHCVGQDASVGQYMYCATFYKTSRIRGSGYEETNTRACLERVNVPRPFILRG